MKFFSKSETIGVLIILIIVFAVTALGMVEALRRARDVQRRADLGAISDALDEYYENFGFFPPSENGKIKACRDSDFEEVMQKLKLREKFDRELFFEGLRACEWGSDALADVRDESLPPYLTRIPNDPGSRQGILYLYLSNTQRFQLYSYLEGGMEEEGYNQGIVSRNLLCGNRVCSFGKTFSETPLDRSIEEYEEELFERSQTGSWCGDCDINI